MSIPQWATAVRYEARVALGGPSLLPTLLLPAYALLLGLTTSGGPESLPLLRVARSFELILPLAAGLSAAYPLTVEREVGFDQLRSTYPEPPWRMPALRIGGTALMVGASVLLAWLIFVLAYGPFAPQETLLPALPPALYLSGLSLLVSRLTGSYWGASATALGYWFIELLRRGEETGLIFLFQHTWPIDGVDMWLNRWLLTAVGTLLTAAAAWHAASHRS